MDDLNRQQRRELRRARRKLRRIERIGDDYQRHQAQSALVKGRREVARQFTQFR